MFTLYRTAATVAAVLFSCGAIAQPGIGNQANYFQEPSSTTGCSRFEKTNNFLQNDQQFRFLGGQCGGTISISVYFSGLAQFYDESDDKDAEASIYIYGPTSTGVNRCLNQHWHDKHFNSFNLDCTITEKVAPYGDISYLARYSTNNIAGLPEKPNPALITKITYTPDQ